MSTKFFTNKADNSLLKKFEGVFKNLPNIHNFDALVGYFRATGYFKLRPFLNEIPEIRILVGINVDTLIQKYHSLGQQYLKNPQIKNLRVFCISFFICFYTSSFIGFQP